MAGIHDPTKWRLVWRSRQNGEITIGEWRDRPEHVSQIAANANAAAGGMLNYWVESNFDAVQEGGPDEESMRALTHARGAPGIPTSRNRAA